MSFNYFNKLNYTLANEDTTLELKVFPKDLNHLMSVAGSGGRVLPLLALSPKRVTCVDLSQEQLYLTELRFQSVLALEHDEFLAFWGYPPSPAEPMERKDLFQKIKLSPRAHDFFIHSFEASGWESLLYKGRWEQTFAKLSNVNRKLTGFRGVGLFTALNHDEHFKYLGSRFPYRMWALTQLLIGNASVFNSLLYKGHFPKKNLPESRFEFYNNAFQRLFDLGPARENFFLQLMFFGKILFTEGCPIECDPKVFVKAKRALAQAEIHYIKGNIVEEAQKATVPVDALSLSDVPSYFNGQTEKEFMQRVKEGLADNALVVIRNYLRIPEGTDYAGFEEVSDQFKKPIRREKTQMYKVNIFKKVSKPQMGNVRQLNKKRSQTQIKKQEIFQ